VANYDLFIKPSAVKEIERIHQKDRKRIVAKIAALASEPRPHGCEKLSGDEKYRLRQGDYRILYEIDGDRMTLAFVKVGHRRDIYR